MRYISTILSAAILALFVVLVSQLTGCAPTQFVLGDATSPPFGCIEARGRGHEC